MAPERLLKCATIRQRICFRWVCCCTSSPPGCGRSARVKPCAACGGGCGADPIRGKLRPDYLPGCRKSCCAVWRSIRLALPTASQLAFELAHPTRSNDRAAERLTASISSVWRRRFNGNLTQGAAKPMWRAARFGAIVASRSTYRRDRANQRGAGVSPPNESWRRCFGGLAA